ncbi:MAG: NCS2 family permease [Candidatus Methanomethylophilaceae archaeon]|nr:NCS2 family permease [Candidatus Methanomethylophilaceae archaeon]
MSIADSIDRFFHVTERGSTIGTEAKGALLIFLSLSYILVVNPLMMTDAGMDRDAAFTATILISIFGCILMGIYANYPVAMAPAMGINAFFVYNVVVVMGYTWQAALAAVFLSGLVFFVLSVSGIRRIVIDAIPRPLRFGIAAGIGCFITFIGLANAGIVVSNPSTLVALGDMSDPGVLLALFCLCLTFLLYARKVPGAIFIGMAVTAVIGVVIGCIALPESVVSSPAVPDFGAFLDGFSSDMLSAEFVMIIISFVFVEFFDSSGTLLAVGQRAGFDDISAGRALTADAATASISGIVGCTPASAFAESTVGVEAGSRTGLTAVFVAALFALALFLGPVFQIIDYRCTVAAMFLVGVAMISELRHVEWDDFPQTAAVLSTILIMLLTYSITDGIAFGLILYSVCMIGAGRHREVSPVLYLVALVSLAYFIAMAFGL